MPLPVRRPSAQALLACAGVLLLAGCGSSSRQPEAIPLERPGAEAVVDTGRRPLSVPPIYGLRPGAVAEPARVPGRGAEQLPPPRTGQEALLRQAGRADPRVREQVGSGPGVAVVPDDQLRTVLGVRPGARAGVTQAERRASRPIEPPR